MEELIDRYHRHVHYLRMSVTDRCDLRCVYCMEEKMQFVARSSLLTLEELEHIAHAFAELGVWKLRITGGEPLVRRNIISLMNRIGQINGIRELTLTTNGTRLTQFAVPLLNAGVKRLNISLDSLKPERFRSLTRNGNLSTVLDGIDAALSTGFENIKINAVILKNRNHDEVLDLVNFALERGTDISFIEEMPLGVNQDHDRAELYYSSDEIRRDVMKHYQLLPSTKNTGGPSRYFKIAGTDRHVGFISPHSHNFCESCNRVRLTCEGRLLLCLGQEHSVDLRKVVREHPGNMDALKKAIRQSMDIKPKGHSFNLEEQPIIFRHMNMTGG
ncbi:MAG: GTP 3',8-cyclase MoaA [Candidatus Eutrophobiaceae bacterium]